MLLRSSRNFYTFQVQFPDIPGLKFKTAERGPQWQALSLFMCTQGVAVV